MEVTVFGFKILSQGFDHSYGTGTWKENTRLFIPMKKIAGRKGQGEYSPNVSETVFAFLFQGTYRSKPQSHISSVTSTKILQFSSINISIACLTATDLFNTAPPLALTYGKRRPYLAPTSKTIKLSM
jgi:hypothetical protein